MPDLSCRARIVRLARVVMLSLLVPVAAMAQSGGTVQDRLGPNQTVEITMGRWDPVTETYDAWDTLGGAYRISPGGDIVLPMIGDVSVLGMTAADLGRTLSARYQRAMGLRSEVQAGVRIVDFGEIYVLGDVQAPGAHPFVPGMTVLQALSQAGGTPAGATAFLQGERNALTALGSYRVLELEHLRRLATLARLNAERDGGDIVVPEEVAEAPLGAQLIQQEREIKEARDAAFQSSLSQLDDLAALLTQNADSLSRQIELRNAQLSLLETELGNASTLVEQGLSTASRLSALERQVADQQVRELELQTALLTVRQSLNETRRDRLELTGARNRQLVEGIQEQRGAIDALQVRMETEAALYAESLRLGTGILHMDNPAPPDLTITRRDAGQSSVFAAARSDLMHSGDVLEVRVPQLDPFDTLPIGRPDSAGAPADLPSALPPRTAAPGQDASDSAPRPPS